MAVFIWIAILACTITTRAISADSPSKPSAADGIRIEGKRFSYDSLAYQRSEHWPGRRVEIKLIDETTYQGRLLYVADDYLFAGPDMKSPSNAELADSFAWAFRYNQIERVEIQGGANFWTGFGYSILPVCLAALGIGIFKNESGADFLGPWAQALACVITVGIPVGIIGGAIGACEGAKKTCYVNGLYEPFGDRVPYWRQCARYTRETSYTFP